MELYTAPPPGPCNRCYPQERRFYDLWGSAPPPARAGPRQLPAPRRPPPPHAESYNPPPEYLLDQREVRATAPR